jgi:hypothetical protein
MRKNTIGIAPLLGGFAALAFLLFAPDTAQAQDGPTLIRACYIPTSGVVYRIGEEGLGDECKRLSHVEFNWAKLLVGEDGKLVEDIHTTGKLIAGNTITIDGVANSITSSTALEFHVNGTRALRLEPNTNVIAGYSGNVVTPGISGATIAGGGSEGDVNRVESDFASVGGGEDNEARSLSPYATIAGGKSNRARDEYATIGGGIDNRASGPITTIGGGQDNSTDGSHGTVGGGFDNYAGGNYATVPGGSENKARADYSFAAGRGAEVDAAHVGTFVWADASGSEFMSTGANQFLIRASGGTTFYSNTGLTQGVSLAPGGGSWGFASDGTLKENWKDLDGETVLSEISHMSIREWNYIAQDDAIRHVGPTAQGFYAAFGLGQDTLTITTSDISGVNMLAIQALERRTRDLQQQTETKDQEIAELRAKLDALLARLERLEGTR